jgi:hypothetical protein
MITPKKKKSWETGSVFLIPLKDGSFCPGQVLGREPSALNSVGIVLFDSKGVWQESDVLPDCDWDSVFSVMLVTKDLLDSGRWSVLAHKPLKIPFDGMPYEELRSRGFVGAKIRGSANVEEFVNAFYGLMPWDDWYVPNYLDDFLISIEKKPIDRLVFCGRHG